MVAIPSYGAQLGMETTTALTNAKAARLVRAT